MRYTNPQFTWLLPRLASRCRLTVIIGGPQSRRWNSLPPDITSYPSSLTAFWSLLFPSIIAWLIAWPSASVIHHSTTQEVLSIVIIDWLIDRLTDWSNAVVSVFCRQHVYHSWHPRCEWPRVKAHLCSLSQHDNAASHRPTGHIAYCELTEHQCPVVQDETKTPMSTTSLYLYNNYVCQYKCTVSTREKL